MCIFSSFCGDLYIFFSQIWLPIWIRDLHAAQEEDLNAFKGHQRCNHRWHLCPYLHAAAVLLHITYRRRGPGAAGQPCSARSCPAGPCVGRFGVRIRRNKDGFLPMARSSIVMIIFFFNHRWSLCLCVGVHGGLDSQSNLPFWLHQVQNSFSTLWAWDPFRLQFRAF